MGCRFPGSRTCASTLHCKAKGAKHAEPGCPLLDPHRPPQIPQDHPAVGSCDKVADTSSVGPDRTEAVHWMNRWNVAEEIACMACSFRLTRPGCLVQQARPDSSLTNLLHPSLASCIF